MDNLKGTIIVVVGATATGKSDLGVSIAKHFDGEVVSADSRQIYRGLDLGSGKITQKEMLGIPHHMLDVVEPGEHYSVSIYKKNAEKCIDDILERKKIPIIVGGTGQYIESIVDGITYPEVPPNTELRLELSGKTNIELLQILVGLDSARAKTIDSSNSRRLIRAIEIAQTLGKVPEVEKNPRYKTIQIGLELKEKEQRDAILRRIHSRIKSGMIDEVSNLITKGVPTEWLLTLGLEYTYITKFLQKLITQEEMVNSIYNKTWQFSRRQMRWFKRDDRITWFSPRNTEKILKKLSIDI